jgi:chromosome partitioning protein
MRTIAVVNQKGGTGKTTLATNLAAAAHMSGSRTLLIDLDPQQTALDWYHQRSEDSKLTGLNVIAFDKRLKPLQFQQLAKGYQSVVIDTPPKADDDATDRHSRCELLAAACLADVVVIPVAPRFFSAWALERTLGVLNQADAIREQLHKLAFERIFVLNMVKDSTMSTKQARKALAGTIGYRDDLRLPHRENYDHVAGAGESVVSVKGNDAAQYVLALFEATQPPSPLAAQVSPA